MTQAIIERTRAVHPDTRQDSQGLHLVPILGPSSDQPPYRVLDQETLSAVTITEISEQGSVSSIQVTNTLDTMVFLLAGEQLVGAKQNRMLNTDVLVPANSTVNVPVSCVEQGRWARTSRGFRPQRTVPQSVRAKASERVHQSLQTSGDFDAAQSSVWADVNYCLMAASCESPTLAMNDAYVAKFANLEAVAKSFQMPEGAIGVGMFTAGEFRGLDLFDRHATLAHYWRSLIDSHAIESVGQPVEPGEAPQTPEDQAVRSILDRSAAGKWDAFPSPGEGKDYRLDDARLTGSGLVWNDQVVVHLQVFPKIADNRR